jgi:hypothetical protein
MKFGEKYELLESLTTGAVETFAANDKIRGERVLVHILDCPGQKPNQSTLEWVLESFRRVAPEPVGTVLESGKYSGTQYAYLVTKPPDEAAVKGWVRRYEIQRLDTRETTTIPTKPADTPVEASIPPASQVKGPEPGPMAGSMTQLFRDFDSQAKERQPIPAPKEAEPARPLPSPSLSEASGLHVAPPWDPVNVRVPNPVRKEEASFNAAPNSAPTDFAVKSVPPDPVPPAVNDRSKAGEFTSFFQGPFRGDAPSELPMVSSQPIEPPRKKVGEFTAIFGQVTAPDQPPMEPSGNAPSGPSFTGMFKDLESTAKPFNTTNPLPGSLLSTPVQPTPVASPKESYASPQAPIFLSPPPVLPAPPPVVAPIPMPPSPSVEKPVVRPSASPAGAATGAFTRPTSEPAPIQPVAPSGPSPYTQIISRASLAPEAGVEEAASAKAAAAAKVSPASMPKVPAMAPPAAPKMPPPPPKPKIAAPAAPKVPKVEAPAAPPVSYWPLVITLTVLFFLAVLLVLYFALKH